MMKGNYPFLLMCLLSITMVISSCVDHIAIPTTEKGKIALHCEIVDGATELVADLSTTGNLNGGNRIFSPEDAIVVINIPNLDYNLSLKYDEDRNQYIAKEVEPIFWTLGDGTYRIKASVPSDVYEPVNAESSKLPRNSITSLSELTDFEEGEKEVRVTLEEPKSKPAYYLLEFFDQVTTVSVADDGTRIYDSQGPSIPVDVLEVTNGGVGIVNLAHRNGILIDHSRLVDNTFDFILSSEQEFLLENQVFEAVTYNLTSVSKEFYDYHKAYSNSVAYSNGQYVDPPIFSNNIVNGVGLFATLSGSKGSLSFSK